MQKPVSAPAAHYLEQAPERPALDALAGAVLLEFGADWCPHCQRARALVQAALAQQAHVYYLPLLDGPGRALGRSYRVKLWPTLIFLRDGVECARLVRPHHQQEIAAALAAISSCMFSCTSSGTPCCTRA